MTRKDLREFCLVKASSGKEIATFDLDLVHSRIPENLDRFISSLHILDAYYRKREDIRLTPPGIVTPLISRPPASYD